MHVHTLACVYEAPWLILLKTLQMTHGINHSNPILFICTHRCALMSDPHGDILT